MTLPRRKRGRPPRTDAEYRRIADVLRSQMEKGAWPIGTVLPSTRMLAEEYGVGIAVIRWALNLLKDERRVKPNARRRLVVQDPGLIIGPTRLLILEVFNGTLHNWIPGLSFEALQRGILRQVGVMNGSLLISGDPQYRFAVPPDVFDLPLKGILLIGQFTAPVLAHYEKLNLPVVLVDRPPQRWSMHAASADNVNAAFDATSRFIKMGHRRIAFARLVNTGVREVDADSRERQEGYVAALKKAGLPLDKNLIINTLGSENPDGPALRSIVKASPQVTAVLAVDAGRALIVEQAAKISGLSVPRDLSIACFQGRKVEYPRFSGPRLDFEDLGFKAARLVLEPKDHPVRIRVPAVWAKGKTAAPPSQ